MLKQMTTRRGLLTSSPRTRPAPPQPWPSLHGTATLLPRWGSLSTPPGTALVLRDHDARARARLGTPPLHPRRSTPGVDGRTAPADAGAAPNHRGTPSSDPR